MTSSSDTSANDDLYQLKGKDLQVFGFARVRDVAYDAVQELWRHRKEEGWTQVQVANNLGCDTGWLSKHLKGPGNWTFKTLGALVQGLNGTIEIIVRPAEAVTHVTSNHGPYSDYVLDVRPAVSSSLQYRSEIGQGLKVHVTTSAAREPV